MTPIRSRWRAGALAVLSAPAMTVETITYPGLGGVTVCQPAGPPREFVIFASGDGGWNKGVARCLRLRRRKVRNVLAFRATEVRHEALRKPDPRRRFVARVPGAQVMMLPKVGHGYSVERNWLPQLLEAFHRISDASGTARSVLPAAVTDLPLVELHASGAGDDRFAIKLSGDGGWAGLDKEVARELTAGGVPVVGWDSLRYFRDPRTPDGAARDLDRVIRHYTQAWRKSRVLLVGYSQGADTMPFVANRLPEESRRLGKPTGGLPALPEIESGRMGQVVCNHGSDEGDSPCRSIRSEGFRDVELPGGHHFDGDYARVAQAILANLPH